MVRHTGWTGRIAVLSGLTALALAGCAGRRPEVAGAAPSAAELAAAAPLVAEGDAAWAEREDGARLRRAIGAWEKAASTAPGDRALLVKLARAQYLLGYGHLHGEEQRAARIAAYDKGSRYGEQALATNPAYAHLVRSGAHGADALVACTADDVPALHWYYANLARWVNEQGIQTAMLERERIWRLAARVNELDPGYFHGSGPRLLATFHAKAPGMAGGDLEKARDEFERSLAMAPDYFATKVLMAELYATRKRDKALFERLLAEVVNGDPRVLPDVVPEQKLEQENARALLRRAGDLF